MSELIGGLLMGAAFGLAIVAIALASNDASTAPAPTPTVTTTDHPGGPR
jgi:hypothetical protein